MSYETKFENWRELVEQASANNKSASAAAASLGIKYDTYKKYAIKYNCFTTNQSGKGVTKRSSLKIPIEDILDGKHPQYQTNKLRLRLLSEGIFDHICVVCKNTEWNGNKIPLELDHINGNNSDHNILNIRLLCPNCHAQTDNYRGKNKGRKSNEGNSS